MAPRFVGLIFSKQRTRWCREDVISICEKLPQFSSSSEIPEGDLKSPTEEALEEALRMGLIRRNARNKTYTLANKWFLPETQSFQLELQEIVRNMPQTLAAALDPANQDVPTSSNHPMDCMGPGMAQRRSPAQIQCVNSANGKNAKLRHVPENGATLDLGHGQDQGRAVHAYEQSASPIKTTVLVTFTITLDGKKSQHKSISTTLM
uniref:Uncharacterized protein n=1 Tax=Anopheles quadriannulatus TaxID=34691 RepID=A0A182XCM7_ANOQN